MTRRHDPADPAITDSWATKGLPQQNSEFASYGSRIKDIVPQSVAIPAEESPFAMPYTNRTSIMHFNFAAYGHLLMTEFFERGGKFEMREFHSPGEVATLKEKVVIHSTGYAARDLWKDKTLMPVRGQTGWLVPQPEANYGLRFGTVSIQAKTDGMVIMNNSPDLGEMLGVGDSNEMPDRAPIEEAMRVLAPIFAAMPGRRA